MKKYLIVLFLFIAIFAKASVIPDEGMWLPMFVERLNYVDMQKMGLHLTADEIYSINHASLKDAVVSLNGGQCTGEVVSNEGLLLTNHHCGYDAIQKHSSVDADYLTDGFWATKKSEELPNEGFTVSFLVRMDDVTANVLAGISDTMTESARTAAITKTMEGLKKEASENGKYDVSVKGFFNGNEYYRFVYEVYKDIRLVGAPPSSIGKFGGDTDNWMWPRHTGDFSIFRIYSAPDGSPATYSKDNVPYKPKRALSLSIKGFQKDDFAMIWGYPGRTDRYSTSWGVEATQNQINPAIVKVSGKILDIMKADMDASAKIRIQYSSDYAGLANFWKNKVGESRDLKRLKVVDKKKDIEDQFAKWVNADPKRKAKYGTVLQDFADIYKQYRDANLYAYQWHMSMSFYGSKAFSWPMQMTGLETLLKTKMPSDSLKAKLVPYREQAKEHFKDYNAPTEEKIYAAILEMFYTDIPKEMHPAIYQTITKKNKNDFAEFASDAFEHSIFATEENFNAFLDKPSLKKLEKDPINVTFNSFYGDFMKKNGEMAQLSAKIKKAQRLFLAGLREMQAAKVFYPDANSTMRMTYGKILDYYPADAVHYDYTTHLSGVMAKEDPTNEEFVVPAKLKELYLKKDFGRYGSNGDLVTCFLTDNDITGGNSGSPVMNGNGELIGLAFDGNWEAMSGNIAFEPELQRTICVDIRYVLFVIDKYAGAKNLIDEMTIVQ
jgi:Peptidase S46